jgi:hypothetical protein
LNLTHTSGLIARLMAVIEEFADPWERAEIHQAARGASRRRDANEET